MMIKVSEKAIRSLIESSLSSEQQLPVKTNNVVDPLEQDTVVDSNFSPQTKFELLNAVKNAISLLPDEEANSAYDIIKTALDKYLEKPDGAPKMKKTPADTSDKKIEENVRKQIRKILSEITPAFDTSFSGYEFSDEDDDDDSLKKKKSDKYGFKSTAIGNMADVGGASFDEIAKDLGFAITGAKAAVDKALEKLRFVVKMDQDELEILVLTAMKDYIKTLEKTGELTPSDVALLKDNPDIVRTLDGFREFLHVYIKRARKQAGAPVEESKKHK
jgi:hypothetical protein